MENKNIKNLEGLINSLEEECMNQGEIKESIHKAINETEEESKSNLINLVFIGNFNAGKTTMINSAIASITNNYDNINLVSSKSENSYFPIVIERAPDEYYYMTIFRSNETPEEIKCQNPEEINTRLEEMDDKATDYLNDLENWEKETDEAKKKELEEKIPEIVVKIKIPNFHRDLRLIDSPGLTNKIMTERLFKLLNENYIMSIFVYLKSFTQEKVTTNGMIYAFFKKIKDNYHNSIFCVCLTKYDKFLNDFLKGSDHYNPKLFLRKKMKRIEKQRNILTNLGISK